MSNKTKLGKNPLFKTTDPNNIEDKSSGLELKKEGNLDDAGNQSIPSNMCKTASTARLPQGWTRGTFIIEIDTLEKIKNFAYWERLEIKEVVKQALDQFFTGREINGRPAGR